MRHALGWGLLLGAGLAPLALAARSDLLQWRSGVYVTAGFAGVFAMGLLLVQPVLAARMLGGVSPVMARRWHRATGLMLVAAVAVHVAGLWVTSPPDVIDVLLFRSPTPFGLWGALALWALVAALTVALMRRRWRGGPRGWRQIHVTLTVLVGVFTALHAVLIDGTMEPVSKAALACGVVGLSLLAAWRLRIWRER